MARLTLILSLLTAVVALLGGFRFVVQTVRDLRWRRKQTGRWLLTVALLLMADNGQAYLTDGNTHTEPTLPTIAAAGDKITDATFGTEIIRLTDNNDSSVNCANGYSDRPAFNVDNTYIQVYCNIGGFNRMKIWNWDSSNNTFSNPRVQSNRQAFLQDYGVQWSRTTYNKFYGCAARALYEVTIPTGSSTTFTNTLVKDFASTIGGASDGSDYCTQIHVSSDDDVFSMHYSKAGDTPGYIVYKRSTNTILLHVTNEGSINEVEIDKSGRYLIVLTDANNLYVWDLQAGGGPSRTTVTTEFFNHRGVGNNVVVSQCSSDRVCKRSLSSPNSVTYLLSNVDTASTQGFHVSMVGPDDYATIGRFSTSAAGVSAPYDNENFQVALDGSGARRFVHNRIKSYAGDPIPPYANTSMDGRYHAFTSNWGGANSSVPTHVYVADMYPPPPGGGGGGGNLVLILEWTPVVVGATWHFRHAILSGVMALWITGGAFLSLTTTKTKQLTYQTTLSTVTGLNYVLSRLRRD